MSEAGPSVQQGTHQREILRLASSLRKVHVLKLAARNLRERADHVALALARVRVHAVDRVAARRAEGGCKQCAELVGCTEICGLFATSQCMRRE
jgi:hypothetical protein